MPGDVGETGWRRWRGGPGGSWLAVARGSTTSRSPGPPRPAFGAVRQLAAGIGLLPGLLLVFAASLARPAPPGSSELALPDGVELAPDLAGHVHSRAQPALEVAVAAAGSVRVGPARAGGLPGVMLPPRPDSPLATWSFELPVPLIRQIGDKSNCGPTTAAMAVAAFLDGVTPSALRDLRNAIGEWTWQRFPRRQRRQAGADVGGSTRTMMRQSLERFGIARWHDVQHPWLPREVWALVALKRHLAERRPLIVLAEAARLWNVRAPGLHWVIVVGLDRGRVLLHDPADGQRTAVPLTAFWTAWRLPVELRSPATTAVSAGFEGLVPDRSLPVRIPPTTRDRLAGDRGPSLF